jgi:voltage-gated potassium channel Kch
VPASRHTLRQRWRYRFDQTMAQGPSRALWWLGAITVFFAVIGGVLLLFTTENHGPWHAIRDFFESLVATVNGGGFIGIPNALSGGWVYGLVSFIVGFGGLIIVSAFIGLLATIMTDQAERLRKGRSRVIETGHTLVLGWSPKVFDIVGELVEANRNLKRAVVVVLADEDPVDMDDALRERIRDRGPTKIVCRAGDPSDPVSLDIARAETARAVIVLASDSHGDAGAVRTTLALLQIDPALERLRLVVEVGDVETARILDRATGGRISTVVSTEVVSRITAQVCRQPGLSGVYLDFLDFEGDEIYFTAVGELAGCTFAQALLSFPVASVIGLRAADGSIRLDPPPETVLAADDTIIAIAEDDDRLDIGAVPEAWAADEVASQTAPIPVEHILVVGWNDLGPMVLRELDANVAPGSTVQVVVDPAWIAPAAIELPDTPHLTTSLTAIERSAASDRYARILAEQPLDHIVLLCYRNGRSAAESDAQTLLSLLQVRQLLTQRPDSERPPSIATELLDSRDVHLAQLERTDDFVVSERLTSLMMTQLAENPELRRVFDEVFSAAGTQLLLEPVPAEFVGVDLTYAELIRRSVADAGIVIGWRTPDGADGGAGGRADGAQLHLNPTKDTVVTLRAEDRLILLRSPRRRRPTPVRRSGTRSGIPRRRQPAPEKVVIAD